MSAAREDKTQLLTDLRRGVDLLVARAEVDPARIGYVGHSLGSTLGGVLVGYGARLAAPRLADPRAWQVLDVAIGVVMLAIAVTLATG